MAVTVYLCMAPGNYVADLRMLFVVFKQPTQTQAFMNPPSGFDAESGWIARAGYCAAWGRLLRRSKAHGSRMRSRAADPTTQEGDGPRAAVLGGGSRGRSRAMDSAIQGYGPGSWWPEAGSPGRPLGFLGRIP